MFKRIKKRNKERWFKIRRFFYRKHRLTYKLRWAWAITGRVFATLFILLWTMCLGVGIVGLLNKALRFTIPMKWYMWLPTGMLFALGGLGAVITIIAGIEMTIDHLKEMRQKIRRKHTFFNYDMEYEIEDRAADQRRKDRQVERAKLENPKWEL